MQSFEGQGGKFKPYIAVMMMMMVVVLVKTIIIRFLVK